MPTMTMMINKRAIIILMMLSIFLSVNAQESRFKKFAEKHNERAFCFYPSSLRMINIGDNPEFDEFVNNINKLLVYKLDSVSVADKLYTGMLDDFKKSGYEEVISIVGGGNLTSVMISPKNIENQLVGIIITNNISIAVYMNGTVDYAKIPNLISTINDGSFINILDFADIKK